MRLRSSLLTFHSHATHISFDKSTQHTCYLLSKFKTLSFHHYLSTKVGLIDL